MAQKNAQLKINPAEETIQVGVTKIRFLVTGEDSNGSIAVFELSVPAGSKFPAMPHSHEAYEETIYGLEGVSTWTIDGVSVELKPGQALCIPRGSVHGFANHGDVESKTLTTMSPATIGPAFFRDMAAVIDAAAGGPPDRAKMFEIMRRNGLAPALPPSPPTA